MSIDLCAAEVHVGLQRDSVSLVLNIIRNSDIIVTGKYFKMLSQIFTKGKKIHLEFVLQDNSYCFKNDLNGQFSSFTKVFVFM